MSRSPAVIVGIDGSRTCTAAAVWAIDEATSRGLPLRLVHAVTATTGGQARADDLACAGHIVHSVVAAIEAVGKPVRVEAQIVCGATAPILTSASRDAAMLCLGLTDPAPRGKRQVRPTVAEVASSAHCPVGIIHSTDNRTRDARWVVGEVGESRFDDATLSTAVAEALLRGAPLRIVAGWPSRYPDIYDDDAVAKENRLVRARWERQLAPWRRRHPDLDVHVTAIPGAILNYLARHHKSIRLAVLAHERAAGVAELLTPCIDCGFDVLICDGPTRPGSHDRTSSSEQSG